QWPADCGRHSSGAARDGRPRRREPRRAVSRHAASGHRRGMTATLAWFARHELRLAWRDLVAMLTAGRRAREWTAAIGVAVFVAVMHGVAWLVVRSIPTPGLHPGPGTLIVVSAAMLLSGSAMLSQAMENVTRAFYSRSDLELILSSPAPVQRLFAVR